VIDAIPGTPVLGYSRGYADRLAHEFSDPADWRGRRVHILGGSPPKQLDAIRQLTRPTLTDEPPADIVGVDWNGLHRGAQFGEFWTADGWDDSGRDADHVTVRKTVRQLLFASVSFGDPRNLAQKRHRKTRASTSSTKGRVLPISNTPPVLSAGRTSGELAAAVRRRIRYWRNLWILQLRVLLQPPSPEQPGGDRRRSGVYLPPA